MSPRLRHRRHQPDILLLLSLTPWRAQSCLESIDYSKPTEKLLIGQNSCFGFEKALTNQAKHPHKSQLKQNYAETLA